MMDSAVDRLHHAQGQGRYDAQSRLRVKRSVSCRMPPSLFVEKGISGAPVMDDEANVSVCSVPSTTSVASTGCAVPAVRAPAGDRVFHEMSSGVRSVQPEQTLLMAARIMCEKHVHRLPVLDPDGKPVGLITSMDVVAALVNAIDERETLAM